MLWMSLCKTNLACYLAEMKQIYMECSLMDAEMHALLFERKKHRKCFMCLLNKSSWELIGVLYQVSNNDRNPLW